MLNKIFKFAIGLIFIGLIVVVILALFSLLPIKGNYKMLIVESGSMEPSIHTGSLIFVRPLSRYDVGDVITRKDDRDGVTITHRIVNVQEKAGKRIYDTKGDANNTNDGVEIYPDDIVGKVYFPLPFVGFAVDFFKRPMGFVIVILIPTIIIIYEEIIKIKNAVATIKEKKSPKEIGINELEFKYHQRPSRQPLGQKIEKKKRKIV